MKGKKSWTKKEGSSQKSRSPLAQPPWGVGVQWGIINDSRWPADRKLRGSRRPPPYAAIRYAGPPYRANGATSARPEEGVRTTVSMSPIRHEGWWRAKLQQSWLLPTDTYHTVNKMPLCWLETDASLNLFTLVFKFYIFYKGCMCYFTRSLECGDFQTLYCFSVTVLSCCIERVNIIWSPSLASKTASYSFDKLEEKPKNPSLSPAGFLPPTACHWGTGAHYWPTVRGHSHAGRLSAREILGQPSLMGLAHARPSNGLLAESSFTACKDLGPATHKDVTPSMSFPSPACTLASHFSTLCHSPKILHCCVHPIIMKNYF